MAVVSLPAGVFQPYSGVKTSILILDKALAKKADRIAFFKVENDGFGLGAQRRPIDKNDLPQVQVELTEYLSRVRAGEAVNDVPPGLGLIVEKGKIAEGGEYTLNGERYRVEVRRDSQYPLVELGKVIKILNGYAFKSKNYTSEGIRVIRITNVQKGRIVDNDPKFYPRDKEEPISKYLLKENDLLISLTGNVGRIGVLQKRLLPAALNQRVACLRPVHERAVPEYIFYLLNSDSFEDNCLKYSDGLAQKNLSTVWLSKYAIPLPPLEMQREIVAEIEGYQKVIDGARTVVGNYRPHIAIDPEWPMVPLGGHFATMSGGTPSKAEPSFWTGQIPWVSPKDMKANFITETEDHISEEAVEASATKRILAGSVVCVVRSGILKHTFPVALLARDMCINQDIVAFKPKTDAISSQFLFYFLKTKASSILEKGIKPGVTVQSFYKGFFHDYSIPLPSLETQQAIVSEIEAEQALVNANRELIERFEKKTQAAVGRVWDEGSA